MEIATGIRRIGNGIVNSYLVEEAGAVTIIDAGGRVLQARRLFHRPDALPKTARA